MDVNDTVIPLKADGMEAVDENIRVERIGNGGDIRIGKETHDIGLVPHACMECASMVRVLL
jgi:hypothetical protein